MTLGEDVKSVLEEVGVAYNIERDAALITGEYLDCEENTQMTKPFTFQFFLQASFSYDSQVLAGDILHFLTDERRYLVMSILPELFENAIIQKSGVLYRTNCVGTLARQSGEVGEYSYEQKTSWPPINSNFPALLVDKLYATKLDEDTQQFAAVDVTGLVLYAPAFVKPLPLHRLS